MDERGTKLKAYLHSWRFRLSSWGSTGLVVLWWFRPQYGGYWLIVAAVALWWLSLWPIFKYVGWENRRIDLKNRMDRNYVLSVVLFVVLLLAFATWYVGFRSH